MSLRSVVRFVCCCQPIDYHSDHNNALAVHFMSRYIDPKVLWSILTESAAAVLCIIDTGERILLLSVCT